MKNAILRKLSVSLCMLFFGILGSAGLCLDPPHNESATPPIDCNACHSWYPGWVTSPRGADQAAVCTTCHNPTGQAAAKSDVAMHVVNNGSTTIDCDSCHNPHVISTTTDPHSGITAPNLDLIRSDTNRYYPGAAIPALFQTSPDHFSFQTAPYKGICQSCHTVTNHHRNTGYDPNHYADTGCVGCHPHIDGFLPTGGGSCLDCHSVAQNNGDGIPAGGRRAITGEFPLGDIHSHYGAALDESDCLVCHAFSSHMDGTVDLVDPDDGSIYTFVHASELSSDPDLSNFCENCHDADGASRMASPFNPFGDGSSAADIKTRFSGTLQWEEWYGDMCVGEEGTLRRVNSHHDISDADQAWSGAKLECLNCHGSHLSGSTQPIADPFNLTSPWMTATNDFCLACHTGGTGPSDPGFPSGVVGPSIAMRGLDNCNYTGTPWWVDFTWSNSAHGLWSKRNLAGYSGATPAVLNCLDCHDSHGSYSSENPVGNPYIIKDFVDGTMYIDDGTRSYQWYGPPFNTYGTAKEVKVGITGTDVDWGSADSLCVACHAEWILSYDWHSFCTGCQTCHGHGQLWGEHDWVSGNDPMCPSKAKLPSLEPGQAPPIHHNMPLREKE